jgi:cytochrome c-type biogenesis protein CcmH/NrfG
MRRWSYLLIGMSVPLAAEAAQATTPRYLDSRRIILSFQTATATPVESIELWASTDGGQSWREVEAGFSGASVVRFEAPADGRYAFYLVLVNSAGRSDEPPGSESRPHATVLVDTVAPTLQVHEAGLLRAGAEAPKLHVLLSLIEENLGDAGVRVFYRTGTDTRWSDGGPVPVIDGQLSWEPPTPAGPSIDIRVVATDLAGNQACEEISDLATGFESPIDQATTASEPDTARRKPVLVAPVKRALVEPAAHVSFDTPPARQTPTSQPSNTSLARLRQLAERHAALGQFSLATARLEDALERAPGDADLLVDLGSILYRAQRHGDAAARFQAAAELSPDHVGAIEGLALVAATQNRYAQARAHLKHLLRLKPESGCFWLRYGDMEHKLGNGAAAVRAWERVLSVREADDGAVQKAQARLKYFAPAPRPARP